MKGTLWWLTIAVLAVGCGAAGKRREPLTYHLRMYNEAVRWSQFDKAALNVPVLQREDFLDERETLAEDLEVDDVQIKRLRFRHDRTWARVDVEYTWHLDSRGIVHKTVSRQIWELSGKNWLITRETHVRGEPMPGLEEAEPDGEEQVTQKTGPDRRIAE